MARIYDSLNQNLYAITTPPPTNPTPWTVINNPIYIPPNPFDPSQQNSGYSVSTIQQSIGSTRSGKTQFDNTQPGYILGSDGGIIKFYIGNSTDYLNWDGTTLTVSGNISATTGSIGGFTIGATTITSTGFVLSSGTTAYLAFGVTPPTSPTTGTGLYIDKTGLFGLSADVQNFKLDANGYATIVSPLIKTSVTVGLGSTGVIMDTAGLRGYDSALGLTFNLPTNGDAPTFSNGIISETIYEINTNSILRTSSTVGDGTSNSSGILINNTGFFACETNQTLANANVKILIDGSATMKMNVKGGQTDFFSGIGYFLGLSAGDYKFSIGNTTTNYMTWDGSYLKIRGSFDVGIGGLINNSSYTVANLPVAPTVVGWNVPSAYE